MINSDYAAGRARGIEEGVITAVAIVRDLAAEARATIMPNRDRNNIRRRARALAYDVAANEIERRFRADQRAPAIEAAQAAISERIGS